MILGVLERLGVEVPPGVAGLVGPNFPKNDVTVPN